MLRNEASWQAIPGHSVSFRDAGTEGQFPGQSRESRDGWQVCHRYIKSLKHPSDSFNILDFVSFCSVSSRSAINQRLMFPSARITSPVQIHFYFSRLPRLWNFLLHFDLNKSIQSIKSDIKAFFWKRFLETFDPTKPCCCLPLFPMLFFTSTLKL